MLEGRLGLETARVPHIDRHGLMSLEWGNLYVDAGTLRFTAATSDTLEAGDYAIPFQGLSIILLGPGCTVSHDAMRLLARHGTGLICIGKDGVKYYASMPFGPNDSTLARRQARFWADKKGMRLVIAKKMFSMRFGEDVSSQSIEQLRGIEGHRARTMYEITARQFGIPWKGRRYDRANPEDADLPNQAINHASTFCEAAAMIAVTATGTIPSLGFIHQDPSISFVLDISDLFRTKFIIDIAFTATQKFLKQKKKRFSIEQITRRIAGMKFRREKLIPSMIDSIKEVLKEDDNSGNT